jgi:hypothetical protein
MPTQTLVLFGFVALGGQGRTIVWVQLLTGE